MSDVLEELYRVKQELASEYSTFEDFGKALLKRQAERRAHLAEPLPIARRTSAVVYFAQMISWAGLCPAR